MKKYIIKYFREVCGTYYWIEDLTEQTAKNMVNDLCSEGINLSEIKVFEYKEVKTSLEIKF